MADLGINDNLHQEVAESHESTGGIAAIGVDGGLLLAQIFNFLLLLLVLRYALYGPMVKLLKDRREKIETGLKFAEKSQRDAQEASQKKAEIIAEAKLEAAQILEKAQQKASRAAEQIKIKAASEVEQMIAVAKAQVEREKSELMAEVENELGQLVAQATRQIVTDSNFELNDDQIDSTLSNLRSA